MKSLLRHIIVVFVGMMLVIGVLARCHHHATNGAICFCLSEYVDSHDHLHHALCHHDDSADTCPADSTDDSACAFHIDDFNKSDNHGCLSLPETSFAIIFVDSLIRETRTVSAAHIRRNIIFHTACFRDSDRRRGPPVC